MKLASLLILPLRTRREMLGALVIAANDPERAMNDEKLPLAEILAERAALAIENAKLYTEQVDARRKVEDLSRLKDEFLSIASHELRTPVTSIKGYTQLAKTLIRENDLDDLGGVSRHRPRPDRPHVASDPRTARRVAHRDRPPGDPPRADSLDDVRARRRASPSHRRQRPPLPPQRPGRADKRVIGDRDRLEQVLGNLMENAVKYSPEGSEITVTVEERGDQLVTSISDRGIGIPADELGQVFERFHRGRQVSSTNYGGLGLGLYITKQIVERHGGTIWVESREGSGHDVLLLAPDEHATDADARRASASAGCARRHLLEWSPLPPAPQSLELRLDYKRVSLTKTVRHYTQFVDGIEVAGGERLEENGRVDLRAPRRLRAGVAPQSCRRRRARGSPARLPAPRPRTSTSTASSVPRCASSSSRGR